MDAPLGLSTIELPDIAILTEPEDVGTVAGLCPAWVLVIDLDEIRIA